MMLGECWTHPGQDLASKLEWYPTYIAAKANKFYVLGGTLQSDAQWLMLDQKFYSICFTDMTLFPQIFITKTGYVT